MRTVIKNRYFPCQQDRRTIFIIILYIECERFQTFAMYLTLTDIVKKKKKKIRKSQYNYTSHDGGDAYE